MSTRNRSRIELVVIVLSLVALILSAIGFARPLFHVVGFTLEAFCVATALALFIAERRPEAAESATE